MINKLRLVKPTRILPIGFMVIILIGTCLLMLPIASKGEPLSFFDAFFEATSATCVTGLVVVDTGTKFTFFGQLILLILIQLGGLGFMTVATILFIVVGKKISLKERLTMAEALGENKLQGVLRLVLAIIKITIIVELIGALLLSFRFIPQFGILKGIWISIFTSISAFCNAGFDLMGNYNSFVNYASDYLVSLTICGLIIIGGLGFVVIEDVLHFKEKRKLKIQTKVVLIINAVLIFIPTCLFFFLEKDETMMHLNTSGKLLAALFQSVTCRTAGFNTINQFELSEASKLLSICLMFIGGSPSGTAGGIKTTTLAVIFFSTRSLLAGKDRAEALERWISKTTVIKAFSIFFIALTTLLVGLFMISILVNEQLGLMNQLFELTSAIATVGLSVGVTAVSDVASRGIICLLMFVGRVGILTIAFALGGRKEKPYIKYPEADIMVG